MNYYYFKFLNKYFCYFNIYLNKPSSKFNQSIQKGSY